MSTHASGVEPRPETSMSALNIVEERVEPINFPTVTNTTPDQIKRPHILIAVIQTLLKIASNIGLPLCYHLGFIYIYNRVFWEEVRPLDLKRFLGRAAERMGVDPYLAKHHLFRDEMLKQFYELADLPLTAEAPKGVLIALQNGTVEISEKGAHLREHRQEDFLHHQLQFPFDATATAPRFEKFLNEVLPDKSCQAILAEYLGYVFIPFSVLKLEKVLILFGSGANGKSVFFEIVKALLGHFNICSYSLENLTNVNGYYRAQLANKLLNYSSEISTRLDTTYFKALASGEPVDARLPYGPPFILIQYAKMIFNCNALPTDIEQTVAFFRRFLIIPFSVTIPEEQQDKELAATIIHNELAGIFQWMLQGLYRLLEHKRFTESVAVLKQIEAYKLQSDTLRLYLEDRGYKTSAEKYLVLKEVYLDYRAFCYEEGFKPLAKQAFKKQLEAMSITIEKKTVGYVVFMASGAS